MMKRYAVMMLVALMLFASVPGFAAGPNPIDPGSLNGTSDILAGTINFNPLSSDPGITPKYPSDVISLDLDGKGNFSWEETNVLGGDSGGIIIRATEETGEVTGSFGIFNVASVDISYDLASNYKDFFEGDLNQKVSFDDYGLSTVPTSLDISWDFSDIGSSRFLFNQILATISDVEYGFGVGALKISSPDEYTVAVFGTSDTDPVDNNAIYFDDKLAFLGSKAVDSLDGQELSFYYSKEEKDLYPWVFIQNWSTGELIVSSFTGQSVYDPNSWLGDDLKGVVEVGQDADPLLIFPMYVSSEDHIGSGTTASFFPMVDSATPYTFGGLNGKFNVVFSPDVTLGINLQEEGSNTGGSSGGCALGFLTPIAMLLIAPLLVLLKK